MPHILGGLDDRKTRKNPTLARFQSNLSAKAASIRDEKLVEKALIFSRESVAITKNEFEDAANWRKAIYRLTNSEIFQILILGLIALNLISLSLRFPNQSEGFIIFLDIFDAAILFLFLIELILKHFAVGFIAYWRHGSWDAFDGVVILFSVFIWAILTIRHENLLWEHNGAGVSGLIALRLLRLIKIMRNVAYFENFNRVMSIIIDSSPHLLWLMFLLILFLFLAGNIGAALFHDDFRFSNIVLAILSVFQIITGQDWLGSFFDGV